MTVVYTDLDNLSRNISLHFLYGHADQGTQLYICPGATSVDIAVCMDFIANRYWERQKNECSSIAKSMCMREPR